jgi:DNA end-binding protein Ku
MARPYWSGRIQISLVSFGVQLYVATEAKSQISFNQISRSTGERVRHQKVLQSAIENSSDGASAAPTVQKDEIVKGYEFRKGEYVLIENSELENLRVPSKHTVDVTQFVNLNELNSEYIEKPYFLVPETDSTEAFAVVRKALQKTGKAAIGTIAFSGREHVFAISAAGDGDRGGMMGYTLRYSNELRDQSDYFRDIKQVEINKESLELAESLIAKKSARLDLSKFEDGYELAVKELVAAKVNHLPVPKDDGVQIIRGNVVNLMDALRKSIGGADTTVDHSTKKPVASAKTEPKKGIGLVKSSSKATVKRKSA